MSRSTRGPGPTGALIFPLAVVLLVLLGGRSGAQELQILVPWSAERAEALEAWWAGRGLPKASVDRVSHRDLSLTSRSAPLVYLAYRQTELETLAEEDRLAEALHAEPLLTFAVETWAPIRHSVGPALATWLGLGALDAAGRLELRYPARDSAEGLVLGHFAALHALDGDELDALVDLGRPLGSYLESDRPIRSILADLDPESVTLAPVRELGTGGEQLADLEAAQPEEGWVRLPLSVGFTRAVPPSVVQDVVLELSSQEGQRSLARDCGVEPLGGELLEPAWILEARQRSRPLDVERAVRARTILSETLGGRSEPPDDPTFWFDVVFLLAILIGLCVAIRRSLRRWWADRRERATRRA